MKNIYPFIVSIKLMFNSITQNIQFTHLQIFALRVSKFLEIFIQSKFRKLVLQMYPEVHVLDRVHDNIDKLHTGDHKFYMKTIILSEIRHERRESSPLGTDFLKVVEC